jgi:hypothetical protein
MNHQKAAWHLYGPAAVTYIRSGLDASGWSNEGGYLTNFSDLRAGQNI